MLPARVFAVAPLALVILALSGCSSWVCTDTTAERGKAGVRVQVVDTDGQPLRVTAEVVDWRLEPHPQTPSEGDLVFFHYRFDGASKISGPAVDACGSIRSAWRWGVRRFIHPRGGPGRTVPSQAKTGSASRTLSRLQKCF